MGEKKIDTGLIADLDKLYADYRLNTYVDISRSE